MKDVPEVNDNEYTVALSLKIYVLWHDSRVTVEEDVFDIFGDDSESEERWHA